jgi:hypothetical protein
MRDPRFAPRLNAADQCIDSREDRSDIAGASRCKWPEGKSAARTAGVVRRVPCQGVEVAGGDAAGSGPSSVVSGTAVPACPVRRCRGGC